MSDEVAHGARLERDERNFGREVRRLRELQGLSQSDLAEQVRAAGLEYVTQTTVSRIENHTRPLRLVEGLVIAEVLGRSIRAMLEPEHRERELRMAEDDLASLQSAFAGVVAGLDQLVEALRNVEGLGERLDVLFAADPPESDELELLQRVRGRLQGVNRMDLSAVAVELNLRSAQRRQGGARGQHQEAP